MLSVCECVLDWDDFFLLIINRTDSNINQLFRKKNKHDLFIGFRTEAQRHLEPILCQIYCFATSLHHIGMIIHNYMILALHLIIEL